MVTPEQITAAAVKPSYFSMPLDQVRWLKGGNDGRPLKVEVYAQDANYAPSLAATKAAFGQERLMFLLQKDQGEVKYYFAGYTPAALQAASPQNLMATETEIARQAMVLANWSADMQLPHYTQVKQLIAQLEGMTREDYAKQQKVFQALEAFGKDAVPAIVAQMDDRRKLAVPSLSLRNNAPDAFEGMRYYGPKQIVDALAAILNQITGADFGFIYNGGSDSERTAAVAGWRIYAADRACEK
jgi:hypothetical protein